MRLLRGEMAPATVFNDDPAAQARLSPKPAPRWLHVVDLDGAFAGQAGKRRRGRGHPQGRPGAGSVGRRHPRSRADQSPSGSSGASTRVVLGTVALTIRRWSRRHARNIPAASCWASMHAAAGRGRGLGARPPTIAALDLALQVRGCGRGGHRLHRHRPRRRAGRRESWRPRRRLRAAVRTPVIASGGIASLDDIEAIEGCTGDGHHRRDPGPGAL